MRYLALCCDYDGTLAAHGQVPAATVHALERVKASGRRVVLVTGREIDDLVTVAPPLGLFDLVVAENGALLYDPASGGEVLLGAPPPDTFVASLRARGVTRLSVGRVIVATWEPHSSTVREALRQHRLDYQVILNKGAVMVLPPGVTKATGLAGALDTLGLSAHNTVGIGDAENDEALLAACECGVAVANALPSLKERADFTTHSDHGAGVTELCEEILANDLSARAAPQLTRLGLAIGHDAAGGTLRIAPYGERLLVLGDAHSTDALVDELRGKLHAAGYSSLLLTPHRHGDDSPAVRVPEEDPRQPPAVAQILDRVAVPGAPQTQVSLAGVPAGELPVFLPQLLAQLALLTARCGRPHWLMLEAVDTLPRDAPLILPHTTVCTTQHLDGFALKALSEATLLIAIGEPRRALIALTSSHTVAGPDTGALAWRPAGDLPPLPIHLPQTARILMP